MGEPMRPQASRPGIAVEGAQEENPPLLRLPGGVEPKRLAQHAKDARPSPPACTLVLCQPDRDDAADGDANLFHAQETLFPWPRVPASATPALRVWFRSAS